MKKAKVNLSERQDRFASRVAGRILRFQRRAADWLNSKTRDFDPKLWILLLSLLCAGFGGYCIRLVLEIIPFFKH